MDDVTMHVPQQHRQGTPPHPMICVNLGRGAPATWSSSLFQRMRELAVEDLPSADVVDLTVSRMSHPAMPDAVLAEVIAFMPDGAHRVRGVGRTPQAALAQVQARLTAHD
ncbi:hypothetical protein [Lentzea sp.]|uniref:hypothetical protein n=1 Tax=Lentzea sp. TaxID=56099 RepID=UPI002ED13345